MGKTALIAVEQTNYRFDKPFSYIVPDKMADYICPGMRVKVPFGGSNRSRQGIVLSVAESETPENLKEIIRPLDDFPVLNDEQLKMVTFLKEQTFCTLFDAAKLMYPAGLNYKIVVKYRIVDSISEKTDFVFDGPSEEESAADGCIDFASKDLSDDESCILSALAKSKKPLDITGICRGVRSLYGEDNHFFKDCKGDTDKKIKRLLDELCEKGLTEKFDDDTRAIGDKTKVTVGLSGEYFGANGEALCEMKLTKAQSGVVRVLTDAGAASVGEICYFTGSSPAVVTNMLKKGLLVRYEDRILRKPDAGPDTGRYSGEIRLNREQSGVYERLNALLRSEEPKAALLFGVTGSGKTSVYLKLIDDVISMGKTVIVTVPEISLTPMTSSLFKSRYGEKVAVLHSGLSMGERLDEWERIRRKEARIVVGTRSAVFAPVENIGLMVMDEEQEASYRSEASPRYHARDALRFRAAYNNALLVMCSATPSVESYMKAKSGIYHLEKLTKRYGAAVLPEVITADMRQEMSRGNTTGISRQLCGLISDALDNRRQVILLLNRRGYNTFIACRECGEVLMCDDCSISMVYHRDNDRVMCHYCGKSMPRPKKCPKCSGEFIRYSGAGTQFAAEQLEALFPNAGILRMDADTTMKKGAHKQGLDAFAAGEYDILIGTQMVAKGLDFPNVTLVGILDADCMFYGSDFRSYERAFSLLTQVIGRAGRSKEKGVAVIQTATPENELIQLAAEQDYEAFFEDEVNLRRVMEYPPFCDICVIGFVGVDGKKTAAAAAAFFERLKGAVASAYGDVKLKVMGPSPAAVARISGKYRFKLIIKCKNSKRFRGMINELLSFAATDARFKRVSVFADMNPQSIM